MNNDFSPPIESPVAHRPRAFPLLAWLVILAACAFTIYRQTVAASEAVPLPKAEIDPNHPRPALIFLGLGLFLAAGCGLFLLIAWFVLVAIGKLRLRFRAYPHFGSTYAETFAVWIVLFLALSYAAGKVPIGESRLLLAGLAMLMSLSALAWPVLRGVSWRRVRYDIGLYPGRIPGLELLYGIGCYAAGFALAIAGAVVTLALMKIKRKLAPGAPETPPTHPAGEWLLHGDWWVRLQVLFAASVAAPIVEETMFRGVLYRHLREASYRWGKVMSIVVGTAIASFLFAAIHPQGWLGIPPLMALATAFTLTREWRGSLLPCMLAHALNNTVVTVLVIVVYG